MTNPANKSLTLRSGKQLPRPASQNAGTENATEELDVIGSGTQGGSSGEQAVVTPQPTSPEQPTQVFVTPHSAGPSHEDIECNPLVAERAIQRQLYASCASDPEPIPQGSNKSAHSDHVKSLQTYSREMHKAYSKAKLRGELLWQDFATSFRPHTIQAWSRTHIIEWLDLLTTRGIYVAHDKTRGHAEPIIDLLYRQSHIGRDGAKIPDSVPRSPRQHTRGGGSSLAEGQRPTNQISPTAQGREIGFGFTDAGSVLGVDSGQPDDDPDHSRNEGSSDGGDGRGRPRRPNETANTRVGSEREDYGGRADKGGYNGDKGRGVTNIIRAYQGQPTYSGAYDEDLELVLSVYANVVDMCSASEVEKRKAMPVMFKGPALSLFTKRASSCDTYEEAVDLIRSWYNPAEKQGRLLGVWQALSLSEVMAETPEDSEQDVWRRLVMRAMSLQDQLHPDYHTDRQLRDRLLNSIDIPRIRDALRDNIPDTSQHLINRVASRLSAKKRSAGVFAAVPHSQEDTDHEADANYSLGNRYGGEARRDIKPYGRNGSRRSHGEGNARQHKTMGQRRDRRLRSSWMRGVKGCFVCGKDHRANDRHSREEVTKAVERLKARYPKALVTVEDLAFLTSQCFKDGEDKDQEGDVEWAQESDYDESDGSDLAYVASNDIVEIEATLAASAFVHGWAADETQGQALITMHNNLSSKVEEKFEGLKLDTGANRRSIMSMQQYKAYCSNFGRRSALRDRNKGAVTGVGGRIAAAGSALIQVPFLELKLVIDVNFLVVKASVPSLLSMKDMKDNGLDLSIQDGSVSFEGRKQKVAVENYFLVHRWKPTDMPFALYTEAELLKIHRNFGHPSVRATKQLLKRASGDRLSTDVRRSIERIAEGCEICARHASAPRRFKLTVGLDDLRFNHTVEVDTMFLDGRPVLHMVDLATHFCAAGFLRSQSTTAIWKQICLLWSLTYLGPPDHLAVDQGSAYVSAEMRAHAEAEGIKLIEAAVENPGKIGTVERYHAPLRAAYNRLRTDLTRTVATDEECLKSAVFSVNATVGPEGLCPMLLVFGAIPRPARVSPSATQIARARAIDAAMVEVRQEQARRQIAFGLRHGGGPKRGEDINKLDSLMNGDKVLVYRAVSKRWEGPYTFIRKDGETVVVQTTKGRSIYKSVCVKPMIRTKSAQESGAAARHDYSEVEAAHVDVQAPHSDTSASSALENRKEAEPICMSASAQTAGVQNDASKVGVKRRQTAQVGVRPRHDERNSSAFAESRRKELHGLIENGTFVPVPRNTLPPGTRVFGSRFVDQVKKVANGGVLYKSRLVAQNYNDKGATGIATKAPTIQRASTRVLLCLRASLPDKVAYTRDVTQAYTYLHRSPRRVGH